MTTLTIRAALVGVVLTGSLASCSQSNKDAAEPPEVRDQAPAAPSPPFVLECEDGVSGVTTDYDLYDAAPLFPDPEGVADRVIDAHPSWLVASDALTVQSVDVAVYDGDGVVQGVLRAQKRDSSWVLAGDRTCDGTSLYK